MSLGSLGTAYQAYETGKAYRANTGLRSRDREARARFPKFARHRSGQFCESAYVRRIPRPTFGDDWPNAPLFRVMLQGRFQATLAGTA